MTEAAKRLRTGAKSSFNRAINTLNLSLSEPTQNEVLEVLHNTVEKRWMSLLDKHEAYLSTLVEDGDNADAWLQEVENSYHDLQVRYVKVKSEKLASESNTLQTRGISLKEQDIGEIINKIKTLMTELCIAESLKRERENLMYYFRLLKADYVKFIEQTNDEAYVQKLNELSKEVDGINNSVDRYLDDFMQIRKHQVKLEWRSYHCLNLMGVFVNIQDFEKSLPN